MSSLEKSKEVELRSYIPIPTNKLNGNHKNARKFQLLSKSSTNISQNSGDTNGSVDSFEPNQAPNNIIQITTSSKQEVIKNVSISQMPAALNSTGVSNKSCPTLNRFDSVDVFDNTMDSNNMPEFNSYQLSPKVNYSTVCLPQASGSLRSDEQSNHSNHLSHASQQRKTVHEFKSSRQSEAHRNARQLAKRSSNGAVEQSSGVSRQQLTARIGNGVDYPNGKLSLNKLKSLNSAELGPERDSREKCIARRDSQRDNGPLGDDLLLLGQLTPEYAIADGIMAGVNGTDRDNWVSSSETLAINQLIANLQLNDASIFVNPNRLATAEHEPPQRETHQKSLTTISLRAQQLSEQLRDKESQINELVMAGEDQKQEFRELKKKIIEIEAQLDKRSGSTPSFNGQNKSPDIDSSMSEMSCSSPTGEPSENGHSRSIRWLRATSFSNAFKRKKKININGSAKTNHMSINENEAINELKNILREKELTIKDLRMSTMATNQKIEELKDALVMTKQESDSLKRDRIYLEKMAKLKSID